MRCSTPTARRRTVDEEGRDRRAMCIPASADPRELAAQNYSLPAADVHHNRTW
jgi:hypothetical protein